MIKKTLILRFLSIFILVLILLLAFLYNLQEDKINQQLNEEIGIVKKEYFSTLDHAKQLVDMIFFNHIFHNDTIISIYQNLPENKNAKREHLYESLKDNFFYFKSYGVDEINFYLNNAEVFLRSKYPYMRSVKEVSKRDSVAHSLYEMKSFSGLEISNTSASVKFIKPLFNKEFQQIGSSEIALHMGRFSHRMSKDINYDISFIFKKEHLANTMFEESFSKFFDFYLNEDYMIEDTIYEKFEKSVHSYDELLEKKELYIKQKMRTGKEFALVLESNKQFYPLIFMPLFNDLNKQNVGYLIASGTLKNTQINEIIEHYDAIAYFIAFTSLAIVLCMYVLHVMVDKTHILQRGMEDLKESIDKFVIMTETDLQGNIVYVTQAFCDACGYTKQELLGKSQNMVRHPEMPKHVFNNMWKRIQQGEAWEGEIKNLDKNGNSYWIKGNIVPIFDRQNKIIGYRSIRVNITDEKQLLKVNSLLKDDLAYKLKEMKNTDTTYMNDSKAFLMGKVLDAFASEWKRPLSNISLELLDLQNRLSKGLFGKVYLEKLNANISFEVKEISNKLNEFKTLFNYSSEEHNYNVFKMIENIISIVHIESNVRIKLKGDENLLIFGLSNDLRQVIINILRNSIEQIELKQITSGKITITVHNEEDMAVIRIKDNAKGIPEEIIDKIFEPEFTTKYNYKSKGLGLYISKLLIEKCHGQIEVENKEKGSCFSIRLPSYDRRKENR
jgi:PAS domain S-box-containing protein